MEIYMTKELATLFPSKEVTLSTGEVLNISPFKFGQLPLALKLSTKISHLLAKLVQSGDLKDKNQLAGSIIYLISEGGEDLLSLVGLGIGKDREWFDTLQSDDGVVITVAFLEVNLDFFTKKMMPQLLQAMNSLKPAEQ